MDVFDTAQGSGEYLSRCIFWEKIIQSGSGIPSHTKCNIIGYSIFKYENITEGNYPLYLSGTKQEDPI